MSYEVIYADPPWRYKVAKSNSRRVENHYPTMSDEDIYALNVPAAENCVLYLWATAPKLVEALKTMESWGFEYKTHAIWDKEKIGMGFWFRGQHELLLVGTKGKVSPPPAGEIISSVFREPRGQHSKKPEGIRAMIEKWYPKARRLEMFCRPSTEGLFSDGKWDTFGNEMANSLELSA